MPSLIILLSGLVASGAWLARRLSSQLLWSVLIISLALDVGGVLLSARLYPLTDVPVLLVALNGGILLGRAIPPRFWPFLVVLVILSVLDSAQQLLPAGPVAHSATRPAGYFYAMFVLDIGRAHTAIGIIDLLLAAAIGEHSRRRSQALWRGILAAPIGLLLADIFELITSAGNIPLIPFLTLGWLIVQTPWSIPSLRTRRISA